MGAFLRGRGEDIEECVWLNGEWEGERNGFAGRSTGQLKESDNQGLRRSKASSRWSPHPHKAAEENICRDQIQC